MDDGSLNGRTMIIHTESFTFNENKLLSEELNQKFQLTSTVITDKTHYYVIKIPYTDALKLKSLIVNHTIKEMNYKIPKIS
jgi:hypothetical protein